MLPYRKANLTHIAYHETIRLFLSKNINSLKAVISPYIDGSVGSHVVVVRGPALLLGRNDHPAEGHLHISEARQHARLIPRGLLSQVTQERKKRGTQATGKLALVWWLCQNMRRCCTSQTFSKVSCSCLQNRALALKPRMRWATNSSTRCLATLQSARVVHGPTSIYSIHSTHPLSTAKRCTIFQCMRFLFFRPNHKWAMFWILRAITVLIFKSQSSLRFSDHHVSHTQRLYGYTAKTCEGTRTAPYSTIQNYTAPCVTVLASFTYSAITFFTTTSLNISGVMLCSNTFWPVSKLW